MMLLVLGMVYATSAVVIFFRDLSQLINIVLQVGIWLTPIMWDESFWPQWAMNIFRLNPMYYVDDAQADKTKHFRIRHGSVDRDTSLAISNLFAAGKQGYTSEEGVYLTKDYVSSAPISVSAGQTLWFGPCSRSQYFELVGFSGTTPVTEKIRGKELTVVDTFSNGKVIYKYTVPAGVDNLVFSVDASVASVFTVCPNVFSALTWQAYWKNQGVNTVPIVGENTYYEVEPGTKIYVGGVTEANMVASAVYDKAGAPYGTISKDDLRLVESFGGAYGIYCYTIPEDNNIGYVEVKYDDNFEMYYFKKIVKKKPEYSCRNTSLSDRGSRHSRLRPWTKMEPGEPSPRKPPSDTKGSYMYP